jgi:hypothetical protein
MSLSLSLPLPSGRPHAIGEQSLTTQLLVEPVLSAARRSETCFVTSRCGDAPRSAPSAPVRVMPSAHRGERRRLAPDFGRQR